MKNVSLNIECKLFIESSADAIPKCITTDGVEGFTCSRSWQTTAATAVTKRHAVEARSIQPILPSMSLSLQEDVEGDLDEEELDIDNDPNWAKVKKDQC